MRRPVIAITPYYNEKGKICMSPAYFNAVWKNGGLPSFVSYSTPVVELARDFDGFLFGGGDDVDPSRYGEEKLPECGEVEAERDEFELSLLSEVMKTGKPVFGICRGIQLINVGLGGTLYQHVEGHRQSEPGRTHDRRTLLSGAFRGLFGSDETKINSFHHQAVKTAAPSLEIVAEDAGDGITEAVRHRSYPYLCAVQWHPELFSDDPESRLLFHDFIGSCR